MHVLQGGEGAAGPPAPRSSASAVADMLWASTSAPGLPRRTGAVLATHPCKYFHAEA